MAKVSATIEKIPWGDVLAACSLDELILCAGDRKKLQALVEQKSKDSPGLLLDGFERTLWDQVLMTIPTRRFFLCEVKARQSALNLASTANLKPQIGHALESLCRKGYIESVDFDGQYRRLKGLVNPAPPFDPVPEATG